MKNYKEKLKDITTFIFDYDGVMTTGEVLVDGNGIPLRSSDVKDGYALQLAVRLGYNVAVITGGYSVSIEKRMAMLGVKDVFVRSANKVEVLERYMKTNDLKPEQIVYMGDDLPDVPPRLTLLSAGTNIERMIGNTAMIPRNIAPISVTLLREL